MANVSGDTGASTDVVEGELGDEGVLLKEEGQGLSDSACSKRAIHQLFRLALLRFLL